MVMAYSRIWTSLKRTDLDREASCCEFVAVDEELQQDDRLSLNVFTLMIPSFVSGVLASGNGEGDLVRTRHISDAVL